jgi:hypothetical protein
MDSQVKEKNISLKDAKQYLNRGDLKEIADEEGLKRGAISNVLAGRSKNWTVIGKILDRAEKNKALKERAQKI